MDVTWMVWIVGDDLEGVLNAQGGEDGQETLRGEQEEYRQEKVRRSAMSMSSNRFQTKSSGHQTESTGEESRQSA